METCKLYFLLLLLTNAEGSRERLQKILHHQPDVIPVCRNDSSNAILLIVCLIHIEGGSCRLTFRPGRTSDPECGSKVQMMVENQTVFLQLSSLGAEDSGNSSCQCSHAEGVTIVELDITVVTTGNRTVDSFPSKFQLTIFLVVLVLVLASGVLLFLQMIVTQKRRENVRLELPLQRSPSRRRQRPNSGPPQTVVEDVEPYDGFQQKENVLYSSSRAHSCSTISDVLT